MQRWTDLAPVLGGGAQVHAAIVAMHVLVAKMYRTMQNAPTRGTTITCGCWGFSPARVSRHKSSLHTLA